MKIEPFILERYFARHEFSARYLLSSSDCEALSMDELLQMADPKTAALWDDLRLGYTESQGHPLLREAIAEIYPDLPPANILTVVPEEGIFILMHALLEPGDHVVCTFPGYQSLYEIARSIGCTVSNWEPDEDDGWRFDVGQLERLIRPDTRLVVINFPHNPTGYLPGLEDFKAIIELVRERGIPLLSDEMYRFLELTPGATLPSAADLYEQAISLFGLSKSFGLPGLRVGWVASQDGELLNRMLLLKDYTTICGSAPSEILGLIAVNHREKIFQMQNDRTRRNIAALNQFNDEHPSLFILNQPVGGSVCFPRLLGVQDAEAFCTRLVEEAGIMLVPSTTFKYGNSHVRIGFGRDDFPEVLSHFSNFLKR